MFDISYYQIFIYDLKVIKHHMNNKLEFIGLICFALFSLNISFAEDQTTEINELSSIGLSLIQQGKFHEALEYFDKILAIDPNDPIAIGNKGGILTQLDRHEEALVFYNKALQIDPTNTNVLNNMAVSLFELGRVDESLQKLDEFLESEPNNVKILMLKGKVLSESKKHREAFSIFKKIIEIEPTNNEAKKLSYNAINEVMLLPIKNSKYLGNVVLYVRNSSGALVSVTVSDALGFLPHEITDEYLDSAPIKDIVIINDKKYEKREFQEILHASKSTFVGRTVLGYDKLGYDVFTFDVLPHGITVEKGDTLTANWTVLRQMN